VPIYQYQCSACEIMFECFETMTENFESGDPHCPKCDPEEKNPPTCFKYLGNCRPSFDLKPGVGGFNKPGWNG